MKILNVHFKNLNSLEGEWQIDFTDPFYISDGIFLITGATGSGKTTVLDAICLALYGATPRLGKITKSSNGIMSRQTGECFAEVIFETIQGRYVCHFSQHRSRKKSDGELQQPKHEISDADTGKILESKLRNVVLSVEKKTGMDFERFTRSILLAQGGFAAFLNATPDERAPILEQITGTEIYSAISIEVHLKKTLEQSRLQELKSLLLGMNLLDKDAEAELNSKLQEKNEKEAELVKKQDKINKIILLQKELTNRQNELQQTSATLFEKKEELGESDIIRVKIEQEYKVSKQERKDGQVVIKKVREKDFHIFEKQKSILEFSSALKQDQEICAGIENNSNHILKDLLHKERLIVGINQYFKENSSHGFLVENLTGITQMFKALSNNVSKMQSISDKVVKTRSIKKTLFEDYVKIKKNNDLLTQELLEKEKEKKALSNEIKAKLNGSDLSALRKNLEDLKDSINIFNIVLQIQKKIKKDQSIIDKEKAFLKNTEKKSHELGQSIESSGEKKEYHEKEIRQLEKQIKLLDRIRDLEQERLLLKSDTPCPLCGSKDHPFALDQIPEKGAEEALLEEMKLGLKKVSENIENLKTDKAKKETEVIKANEKINEFENEIEINKKESAKLLDDLKPEMPLDKMLLHTQSKVNETTNLIKEVETIEDKLKELGKILEKKRDIHARLLLELQKAEIAKTDIGKEILRLIKEKESISEEVEIDKGNVLEKLKIFGIKSIEIDEIDDVLDSLKQKQDVFQKNKEKIDLLLKEVTSMNSDLANSKVRIKEIQERTKANQVSLTGLNKEFDALNKERRHLFAQKNPDVEEKFLDKKVDEFEKIYEKAKQTNGRIKHELKSTATRVEDLNKLISILNEKLSKNKAKDFDTELKVLNDKLKDLQQSMGSIKQQLKQNKETKEKHREQVLLIENQKKECNRWDILHELIGSADGKKFRNFAQGLTFELMINHANNQLKSMTDRYLLVRDRIKPLELNVIDNYQAGEIRSTKNLSGGEGFIVSLSLALGLSRMVSKNISVDSLFLDEGFGTLDADALETALEALSSLQQAGKIIGLISHVPALKERIGVQIQIKAGMGGRSSISGPGCSKVKD